MARLRIAKRRAALAIALADIAGLWPLERVTSALTEFADASVKGALRFVLREAAAKAELPQRDAAALESTTGLTVLAMGKYGAFELNYSSDIDLVVFYDPRRFPFKKRDDLRGAAVDLVRGIVKLLTETTADGYVFRVDLRLRPDAGATQVAISIDAAESYYEGMGQNWERAAFIKARACAGDPDTGAQFLKSIVPFIWRRHLDYAAIEDIHSIKRQIHAHEGHGAVAVAGHNIKLGRGGIREIEFFAQTQQLILGGRLPELRKSGTMAALDALCARGLVSDATTADLKSAYRFLRTLEHRLQMIEDQQTHTVPKDAEGIAHVACFMGFASAREFSAALTAQLETVQAHYARLFEREPELTTGHGNLVFTVWRKTPQHWKRCARWASRTPRIFRARSAAGITAASAPRAARAPASFSPSSCPCCCPRSPATRRSRRGLHAVRPLPHQSSGRRAAFLAASGAAGFPAPHRRDLRFRAAPRAASRPRPRHARRAGRRRFPAHAPHAHGARRPARRPACRRRRLRRRPRCRAPLRPRTDFPRRRADHRRRGPGRSGRPPRWPPSRSRSSPACCPSSKPGCPMPTARVPGGEFAVVAMGKLGGREMTAGSDLDLVFIYDTPPGVEASDGARPLPVIVYYARLAQRFISALTTPTAAGNLYEVDMRLRPTGNKGPVAVSLASFRRYHTEESWDVGAHGAHPRPRDRRAARAGARRGGRDRAHARCRIGTRRRSGPTPATCASVWQRNFRGATAGTSNSRPAGWWMSSSRPQTLQLCAAPAHPEVLDTNTIEALRKLEAAGALSRDRARRLIDAAALEHALTQVLRIALDGGLEPDAATPGLKSLLVRAAQMENFAALEKRLASLSIRRARNPQRHIGPSAAHSAPPCHPQLSEARFIAAAWRQASKHRAVKRLALLWDNFAISVRRTPAAFLAKRRKLKILTPTPRRAPTSPA